MSWLLLIFRIFVGFPVWPTFKFESLNSFKKRLWIWTGCTSFKRNEWKDRNTSESGRNMPNHVPPSRGPFYTSWRWEVMKHGEVPSVAKDYILRPKIIFCRQMRLSLWSPEILQRATKENIMGRDFMGFCRAGICYIMEYNTPRINNGWLSRTWPGFWTIFFYKMVWESIFFRIVSNSLRWFSLLF